MEFAIVADNIAMSQMVIKNHGPGIVGVYAGYGDQKDLAPGKFRVTSAYAKITVESKEEKSALLEMQSLPGQGNGRFEREAGQLERAAPFQF